MPGVRTRPSSQVHQQPLASQYCLKTRDSCPKEDLLRLGNPKPRLLHLLDCQRGVGIRDWKFSTINRERHA